MSREMKIGEANVVISAAGTELVLGAVAGRYAVVTFTGESLGWSNESGYSGTISGLTIGYLYDPAAYANVGTLDVEMSLDPTLDLALAEFVQVVNRLDVLRVGRYLSREQDLLAQLDGGTGMVFEGSAEEEYIRTGPGENAVRLYDGRDTVEMRTSDQARDLVSTLAGGSGWDALRLPRAGAETFVDLSEGKAHWAREVEGTTYLRDLDLSSFEEVRGAKGPDTFIGSAKDNTFYGGRGRDRLSGSEGDDFLSGEKGRDILRGESGEDLLLGGNGEDRLFGGRGADRLSGGDGNDVLKGGKGNDTLDGGYGDNTYRGGAGADVFEIITTFAGDLQLEHEERILDFETGVDQIELGYNVDLEDVTIRDLGAGETEVLVHKTTILVSGPVVESDFIF